MDENPRNAETSYAIGTLESSISGTLMLIAAVSMLSYSSIARIMGFPIGQLLAYFLTIVALIYVGWLAVVEKALRIPKTTLALPAIAFFFVLTVSKLEPRPPFGLPAIGSFDESALTAAILAVMAYLGYTFLDSRRDRRRLLVMTGFLLVTSVILDGVRTGLYVFFSVPGGRFLTPSNPAESGLYLAFILPVLAAQVFVRKSWLSRYSFVPPLLAGLSYLIGAAPGFAAFAVGVGIALVPLLSGKRSAMAAASIVVTLALLVALIGSGRTPPGGWPRETKAQSESVPAVAIQRIGEQARTTLGLNSNQPVALGAAPILLLLVLVAGFFMQGVPELGLRSDVERAYILGVLAGMGGYAIASVAFGNSIVASPAIWLMIGAGARLINPNEQGVLYLNARKDAGVVE